MGPVILAATLLGAQTVPPERWSCHFAGGLAAVDAGIPVIPAFPYFSGDAELIVGLLDGLDARLRYTTQIGVLHRLTAEARARVFHVNGWTLAARLATSAGFGGAWQEAVDYTGDVSTSAGLAASYAAPTWSLTLEAGGTMEWLVYEDIDQGFQSDTTPFYSTTDLALEWAWSALDDGWLSLRLEHAISAAPDDPFTVLGGYPRLLFGGGFWM